MVFVASFTLSMLCDLFSLDFQFCLCLVHGHATLFVVSYIYLFFMVFFLFVSFFCFLCFKGLGIWLGNEEN